MKVLFAVSNEKISESVIEKYQILNNELLSYKSVYYYNAIRKELEGEFDYECLVVDEELEAIANDEKNSYLLNNLDIITDLLSKTGKQIPIIFICKKERTKGEMFLEKIYKLGIFNALIGQDRKITKVCELIKNPRDKEEAKKYYEISVKDVEVVGDDVEDAIAKNELKNILRYYSKLGEDSSKYSETFDRISEQYSEKELSYIISKLPENVVKVLQAENNTFRLIKEGKQKPVKEELINQEIPTEIPVDIVDEKATKNEGQEKINIAPKDERVETVPLEFVEEENIPVEIPKIQMAGEISVKSFAFVGTSKNGVSFIVNSLGMILSSIGVDVAILDLTKNKNDYYMVTNDEDRLRELASTSIIKLDKGIASGIQVNKNLTVYTGLPENDTNILNPENIVNTLKQNHKLVLIDADFNTNIRYFGIVNEIVAVQSLDILTIQPLREHLKKLKENGIELDKKINIILNKEVGIRGLTKTKMVGGISTYNNAQMTERVELFDKDRVKVFSVPFDIQAYQKYLENIVHCKFEMAGYPKEMVKDLKLIAENLYPEIAKD